MLTKMVRFDGVRFPVSVYEELLAVLLVREIADIGRSFPSDPTIEEQAARSMDRAMSTIATPSGKWSFDSVQAFLLELRNPHIASEFAIRTQYDGTSVAVRDYGWIVEVEVSNNDRMVIEQLAAMFADAVEQNRLPSPPPERPRIFIGHGRSPQWRELSDFLHHQMGYEVEAFETLPRAGHDIERVLKDMLARSNFALLVMTAEDAQPDGVARARQNVVHEIGLWQGHLGWDRAIVLLEEGAEDFSNLAGVQQLRFPTGKINSVTGDILATLKREFGV